ncbi:MAG: hypothetical protein M3Y35_04105 [Actinomycetota bacterium]|nr:hypothetical protein [Actinomycetota bacterium]
MSSPGSRPKKSGFMANLQAAMVPAVPDADGGPLLRPRAVTIASVLAMVAGVVFLLLGILSIASASSQVDNQAQVYVKVVAQCNQFYNGIGSSAVPTTATTPSSLATTYVAATALPGACRGITESRLSNSELASYRTSITVFSIVLIVVGLATAVSGWFLREGRKWSRRVLISVVLVQLILAFLFQVSNVLTLLATLLVVVALSMTFLGRASGYFLGVALRKKAH